MFEYRDHIPKYVAAMIRDKHKYRKRFLQRFIVKGRDTVYLRTYHVGQLRRLGEMAGA